MKIKGSELDKKYRPDIDGLRAIAVMAVVFFHLDLFPFTGGYIGVDVFFVISGFLITRILCREIDEGRFSIIRFYERRMRRIAPALFAVIFVSMLVGYFMLFPNDLKDLGKSVRYTLLMAANIYWWKSLDYFSAPADGKPMLHMWSLGVEEQFYIFLPLILLFIAFKFPRWRVKVLWGLLLLSFIASIVYIKENPPTVFFWLPFRAWELLAGSVIVFLPSSGRFPSLIKGLIAALGLFLVVAPIFYLQKFSLFPGLNALPPVLGSALLIWAGTSYQGGVARILSLKPVVYIGLISYSLYLWHWPMVVYTRYWFYAPLTMEQSFYLIIAIFIVSMISYHIIERPFRDKNKVSAKGIFYFTFIGVIVLMSIAIFIDKKDGLPNRLPDEAREYLEEREKTEVVSEACDSAINPLNIKSLYKCRIGDPFRTPTVLLLGDSFAGAISGTFGQFLQQNGQAGIVVAPAGCPPIIGLGSWAPFAVEQCQNVQKNILKIIDKWEIKTVVLYSRWPAFETSKNFQWIRASKKKNFQETLESAFAKTISEFEKRNIKIVIFESAPVYDRSVPYTMARNLLLKKPVEITMPLQEFLDETKTETKLFSYYKNDPNILFIDLKEQFCIAGVCNATLDRHPLYWDEGHLNRFGSILLMPAFEKMKPFLNWSN